MSEAITIEAAQEADAAASARIHLEAMDYNILLHAQFPGAEALKYLKEVLDRDTVEHVRDGAGKGAEGKGKKRMLVARVKGEDEPVAFVKWSKRDGGEEDEDEAVSWPGFCRAEYLDTYGEMTAAVRRVVLGSAPHYHVTFLCTKPAFGGRGAATALLREVQRQAAAEDNGGSAVVLESTMNAVSFYERLGFQDASGHGSSIEMKLPARGRSEPTEVYEERCMVWRPSLAGGVREKDPMIRHV